MKLVPVEEGFEVVVNGCGIGYVFEDVYKGWRPYSIWGHCMTTGRKSHSTVFQAAAVLLSSRVRRFFG